jgi:DNA mismatch repair ATPase MutS
MYPDRDFDLAQGLPPNEPDLSSDLELSVLLRAMAGDDKFLFAVARQGLHSYLVSPAEIVYRQHVLTDCIAQSTVVRDLYDVAVAAIIGEKRLFGWTIRDSPESILYRSRQLLLLYLDMFRRLRDIADAHASSFRSEGLARLFAMLARELNDEYLAEMKAHVSELEFRRGTLISAQLGPGGKGTGYILRRHPVQSWRDRIPRMNSSGYTFFVPERDESGMRTLSDLNDRGLNGTANALAQSADHIRSFFEMLRAELGFYLSCLNLRDQLTAKGEPVCFPVPASPVPASPVLASAEHASLSARGLYDASLALSLGEARTVGNDLAADGKQLIMVTGANEGGKSTFLRSVGLAQLMMQAGMFVAAESYAASVSIRVFTHFKREEDATMEKGKLDEELDRMSTIIGQISAGCLLLCNESFASTNEREGSEIARQIIHALTEAGIRVVFVTHLYDLAERYYEEHAPGTLFLRAERRPDGQRTFRLLEGEPLPTSYGQDLYKQVFGTADQTATV